ARLAGGLRACDGRGLPGTRAQTGHAGRPARGRARAVRAGAMTRHQERRIALRIALVDDHVLFRDGLRTLVSAEHDLLVVAEASDARTAFPLLEEATPDVLVVDVTLPGSSGIALTR